MIRVLQFADVINRHDFIDTIIQYADPQRFEVSVCVRNEDHGIAAPEFSSATRYRVIPGRSRMGIPAAAMRLAALLREWKIDVVHSHHYDQAVIAWLATVIYPRAKLVIGRHYSDSLYRLPNKLKSRAFLAVEQVVNRHAARIIAPSAMIFQLLTERQGIAAEKVDVVHYGFVPEKYSAVCDDDVANIRREFGMDPRFVVGNFSRLHEEKGHRYLIEAAAILKSELPELLVLLIGEGPERANIERQIKELNLEENVKLTGWRSDAMAIMAAVDAVVQSTLQEAFSQAMIEALWMSKPLVITDVSGSADVVRDGENGLLVPKADASALAAAIKSLADDPELRVRLGSAGHEYVVSELEIGRKIREYERVFERVVSTNG